MQILESGQNNVNMKRFWKIVKYLAVKVGKFIWYTIERLASRILYFLTEIVIGLACYIIYLVTFEPFTWKKATKRKAKRIRTLTKLKLYAWKYCSGYFKFIHDDKYLSDLYNKFSFLIEEK